jgi:hypothetical protein
MNRIALIAVAGLGIAAVCAVAAAAVGVRRFHGSDFNLSLFDRQACAATGATATSRSLAWDGGDSVTVQVPATIHYRRGAGDRLEVKGDPLILSHLTFRDGKISLDCNSHHWRGDLLDITLPGREIRDYTIAGRADLDLQQIEQDRLKIVITGRAKVRANGKVDNLDIEIMGRGDTLAKDLIADTVKILIAGRGDIETSPIDDADITIMGRGDVSLYTEPRHLDTSIMGRGNIRHLAADKS